jgi:iron complex outermembrane receptor protein
MKTESCKNRISHTLWVGTLAAVTLVLIAPAVAAQSIEAGKTVPSTESVTENPHTHPHGFHDNSVEETEPRERVYSFGIDEIVVTGSPLPRKASQLAGAVSTLTAEQLFQKQQPTIGETLRYMPGVSATYFGPGASRPILRGLGGSRVQMLIDQLAVPDASATSNDHAVTIDTLGVEKIEILRGPATLRFGPNAVGGVVNTIEHRVPKKSIGKALKGSVELRGSSVNGGFGGAAVLTGEVDKLVYRLKGFGFTAGDVSIPGYAESKQFREQEEAEAGEEGEEGEKEEAFGSIPNSQVEYTGFNVGASWVDDKFFAGAAVSNFQTNYGVIFHEAGHDHGHGGGDEDGEEPPVLIDMNSWALDFAAGITDPFEGLHSAEARLRLVDYEHFESEGSFIATTFKKKAYDLRVEAVHERLGILEGAVGFQSSFSDFKVSGEEGFLPNTYSSVNSIFVIEEIDLAPVTFEVGGRFDYASVASGGGGAFGPALTRDFPLGSVSTGLIYDFMDTQFVSLDASWSMRAPSYEELYARGVHVATGFFEIGDPDLNTENAVGLNIGYAGLFSIVDWSINVFYNRFWNFTYLEGTGVERDEIEIGRFIATSAQLAGGELEVAVHLLEDGPHRLHLIGRADGVYAQNLETNQPLPRMPPVRFGGSVVYEYQSFRAELDILRAAKQDRVPQGEFATAGYTMLDLGFDYELDMLDLPVTPLLFFRMTNLLNEEARASESFLRDRAPLPGRNFTGGVRITF